MSLFNSLGSNYDAATVRRSMLTGSRQAPAQLQSELKKQYKGRVVLTYKGREAIAIVLQAAKLKPGSYVAVNGYTCYAVYEAITAVGLKPYYLDIPKNELHFTAVTLGRALKRRPEISAVMIQNTLGIPAEVPAIKKICDRHGLPLIEDLAHSEGLVYEDGHLAGTVGFGAILSFSQDKMLDGVSGGAAVLPDKASGPLIVWAKLPLKKRWSARCYPVNTWLIHTYHIGLGRPVHKLLKSFGLMPNPMQGTALPAHHLDNWHSTLALRSWKVLPEHIEHRQRIAAIYRELLPPEVQFKYHQQALYLRFPIHVPRPAELIAALKSDGIYVGDIWYDAPVAPKRYQSQTDYQTGDCPNAELVAEHMVNLPTHIIINEAQAAEVARKVKSWLSLA